VTSFDDPNREAVGLEPAWTGAGDDAPEIDGDFDPGAHTVSEVEEYIAAHPDEAEAVLEAERTGKARVSLIGGDAA
jgi:hypothetical protein